MIRHLIVSLAVNVQRDDQRFNLFFFYLFSTPINANWDHGYQVTQDFYNLLAVYYHLAFHNLEMTVHQNLFSIYFTEPSELQVHRINVSSKTSFVDTESNTKGLKK